MRAAYVDKNGMRKGPWSEEENRKLRDYILRYGHWNWRLLPRFAGLDRCGKSCRLRWMNYLKPGIKLGNFTKDEEEIIVKLHNQLGNKWSTIAAHLPGRTDNEIKNYWNTGFRKHRRPPAATTLHENHAGSPKKCKSSHPFDVHILESSSSLNGRSQSFCGSAVKCDSDQDSNSSSHQASSVVPQVVSIDSYIMSDHDSFAGFNGSFWNIPDVVDQYLCRGYGQLLHDQEGFFVDNSSHETQNMSIL